MLFRKSKVVMKSFDTQDEKIRKEKYDIRYPGYLKDADSFSSLFSFPSFCHPFVTEGGRGKVDSVPSNNNSYSFRFLSQESRDRDRI